jgi:uncharacterized protein YecE (DUF72 family)
VLARQDQIIQAYQRYLELRQLQERCEQQFRQLSTCHKEQHKLEKIIQQARAQIEKEQAGWRVKQTQEQQVLQEAQHILQQAQVIDTVLANCNRPESKMKPGKIRNEVGWLEREQARSGKGH